MIEFILLLLASGFGLLWVLIWVVNKATQPNNDPNTADTLWIKKYKVLIGIVSILSVLMVIAVERKAYLEREIYLNPDGLEAGTGLFFLFILVIGWFFIFIALFIGGFISSLATREEDGCMIDAIFWIPSILVSVVDILLIAMCLSTP